MNTPTLKDIIPQIPTPDTLRWRAVVQIHRDRMNPADIMQEIREAQTRGDLASANHLEGRMFEMTIDPVDDETAQQAHRRFVEVLAAIPVEGVTTPTLYLEYE